MESIRYFFGTLFGGLFDRLSDQIRYKITDVAESKIRETVDKPFNQSAKNKQEPIDDRQNQNLKS